jgi:hypothetical protein
LDRNRDPGMIDFQNALKAVQNLIAQQEFVSIRDEIRSADKKELAEHGGAPPVNSMPLCFFYLEGESEAKISLYKVVV